VTLEAILFDFGNTLVSTRLDWDRIMPMNLAGLKGALRSHFPGLDVERLARDFTFLRAAAQRERAATRIEVPAVETLARALSLQGLTDISEYTLQEAVDGFFAAEEAAYPIIFGIPETVAKLKEAGFKLAVVSNATCGKLVRRALERRLLLGQFDHVAVSADLGPRKPDPAIFRGATNALGVDPAAAAMVGDRPDKDIAGAHQAGLRTVLADFFGDQPEITPSGPRPDAVVRYPHELVELFQKWKSGA
jgi:HAD superfamily hydrolase (TIGR01549 family)